MTRFIIVSDKSGVFLGSCLGFCFWSNLDAVGQDSAITFDSHEQAQQVISDNPTAFPKKENISVRQVEIQDNLWASMAECMAVGVSDWTSNM